MAKSKASLIQVNCPCCQAELQIDPKLGAVIKFKEPDRPRTFADFEAAVERQKGEAERREEAFRKSVEEQKTRQQLLDRKFDELLKQAKEHPDEPPPKRDIDFD